MYLLRYQHENELRVVVIDAYSVAHARLLAARLEPGIYVEGQQISRAAVARCRIGRWAGC